MLLAIDIGNSNLVIGIYQNGEWLHNWRLPTLIDKSAAIFYHQRISDHLWEAGIKFDELQKTVISSVVPGLTQTIQKACQSISEKVPLVVGPKIYPHLPIKIINPYEIGADLVANMVAAHLLYQKDCIVVDFGTALTFTTLDQRGNTLGVSIAPGLKTATTALYQKTAQLPPEVPMEMPPSPLGMSTIHAIQSGVLIGYVGLVNHMIDTIRREVGEEFITIATGGLSKVLTPLEPVFDFFNPNLTLEGLRLISEIQDRIN